jgi:hypothetical protein
VLVNGEHGDLICHQCGLKQGDPLSPMLFIMVMDVLNSLVTKASELGLLQPLMRVEVMDSGFHCMQTMSCYFCNLKRMS